MVAMTSSTHRVDGPARGAGIIAMGLIVVIAIATPAVSQEQGAGSAPAVHDFREASARAKGNGASNEPDRFECKIGDVQAVVSWAGEVRWSSGAKRSSSAVISLPKGATQGLIRKMWCGLAGHDLLLAYRADYFGDEGDFAGGGIARIAVGISTLRWIVHVAGNLGEPLFDGRSIYVTGIGLVGKVDARSGRYLWRYNDLFRMPGMYSAFGKPRKERDRVVFEGIHFNDNQPVPPDWPRAVVVIDSSGRMEEGRPQ